MVHKIFRVYCYLCVLLLFFLYHFHYSIFSWFIFLGLYQKCRFTSMFFLCHSLEGCSYHRRLQLSVQNNAFWGFFSWTHTVLLWYLDQSPCFTLCNLGLLTFYIHYSCHSSTASEFKIPWSLRMVYTELCLTCSSFQSRGISS